MGSNPVTYIVSPGDDVSGVFVFSYEIILVSQSEHRRAQDQNAAEEVLRYKTYCISF